MPRPAPRQPLLDWRCGAAVRGAAPPAPPGFRGAGRLSRVVRADARSGARARLRARSVSSAWLHAARQHAQADRSHGGAHPRGGRAYRARDRLQHQSAGARGGTAGRRQGGGEPRRLGPPAPRVRQVAPRGGEVERAACRSGDRQRGSRPRSVHSRGALQGRARGGGAERNRPGALRRVIRATVAGAAAHRTRRRARRRDRQSVAREGTPDARRGRRRIGAAHATREVPLRRGRTGARAAATTDRRAEPGRSGLPAWPPPRCSSDPGARARRLPLLQRGGTVERAHGSDGRPLADRRDGRRRKPGAGAPGRERAPRRLRRWAAADARASKRS